MLKQQQMLINVISWSQFWKTNEMIIQLVVYFRVTFCTQHECPIKSQIW